MWIDWHVCEIPAALRSALSEAARAVDVKVGPPAAADAERVATRLRPIAARDSQLIVDALVPMPGGRLVLVRARNGVVTVVAVQERVVGSTQEVVTDGDLIVSIARKYRARVHEAFASDEEAYEEAYEHDGPLFEVPTAYVDEDHLRASIALLAEAIDDGSGAFVASTGDARFLVEIVPGASAVQPLEYVTEPALINHLLTGAYEPAPTPTHRAQMVLWNPALLARLDAQTVRSGETLSQLVERACVQAMPTIAASTEASFRADAKARGLMGGDRTRREISISASVLDDIGGYALETLDTALSVVIMVAVEIAWPAILALPSATTG